jgi:hypothetical protein
MTEDIPVRMNLLISRPSSRISGQVRMVLGKHPISPSRKSLN